MSHVPQKLLSIKEVAKILNVCRRTLWTLLQPRGELPVVRLGRRRLVDAADLEKFIESRKSSVGMAKKEAAC